MMKLDNRWLFSKVEEELNAGRSIMIKLVGCSMSPTLKPNRDSLNIIPISFTLPQKGDVVLAKYNGDTILHRVVAVDKNMKFTLRGDANLSTYENVEINDILGVLVSINRDSRSRAIECSSFRWRAMSCYYIKTAPVRYYLRMILSNMNRIKRLICQHIER